MTGAELVARRRATAKARGARARSRLTAGGIPAFNSGQAASKEHLSNRQAAAEGTVEPEALAATHWFDSGRDGEPYSATVRFTGRRVGVQGKPRPADSFAKEETMDRIVPGSGPVSITTWVHGLEPGEWTVTADLIRTPGAGGAQRLLPAGKLGGSHTLPRATWSWKRWALTTGPFTPVKTRFAPLVRMARMPAVIPGSWSGLVGLGILVGFVVQTTLLGPENVALGQAAVVDSLAVVSGLIGAKLWYVIQQPRSWRQSIGEGWSVNGSAIASPAAVVVALFVFGLPIGVFFDASAPALFFGIAIGRLGCFFTGCCAGRCTRSRWGVWSSDRRVGARRIPAQLLESAAGLLIAVASTLLVLRHGLAFDGAIFVAAAAAYILVRHFLLQLRAEPHNSSIRSSLTAAIAALVLLVDGVLLLVPRT